MLAALIKCQLAQTLALYRAGSSRKNKMRGASTGIVIGLLLLLALSFGAMFFLLADRICAPMVASGLGWLYFTMMAMIALVLGLIGSVFTVSATLYNAKDNDLLLSMPIPPSFILAARLFGVWFWTAAYELVIMLPTLIVYIRTVSPSIGVILCDVLFVLLLSVATVTLSCVLGWCVAKLARRIRGKAYLTVVIALLFLGAYFYVYSRAYEILMTFLSHMTEIGEGIRGYAYALYVLGRMGEGDAASALWVTLAVVICFVLVYFIMSRTFIGVATDVVTVSKGADREQRSRVRSVSSALFAREVKRFTSSSTYMLNAGLGVILMPAVGIFALIKADMLRSALTGMDVLGSPLSIATSSAAIVMLAGMNMMTASSVSLEGRTLWITRSLPVTAWQVLSAKLRFQLALTAPSVLICALCLIAALRPSAGDAVLLLVIGAAAVVLSASFGLWANLRFPNLDWTSEITAIKQSASVVVTMLGMWALVIVLAVLTIGAAMWFELVPLRLCLWIDAAILAALDAALILHLKHKGAERFERI